MRIAFVSDVDPYDRAAFSGSTYQILQLLLATGAKVEVVGPVMQKWRFKLMRLSSIPYRLTGHGVAWPKHPFILRPCAEEVDKAARRLNPDIIFSPGSNPIAYSSFLKPTVFWSDAPFAAMVDYYPWPQFQKLTRASRKYGMDADTRALGHAAAAIYRSSWGRDAAIREHGADPARVHVLALPGNLFRQWTLEEVRQRVPGRLKSPWKIFFSGVDWKRKGGDHAVAIVNELQALGQLCELYVAGVMPPPEAVARMKFTVHALGRLNLNKPENRETLCNLLQDATFFLVPSTAEALGLVFCEALSAGVPSVGRATGGVPDAVIDGKTGFLIQPGEPAAATAQRMLAAGRDEKVYTKLAETGWNEWNSRLAHDAVVARLTKILEAVVG